MPEVQVIYFREENGEIPALTFLRECHRRDRRIAAKLQERIERLEEKGWELTRPEADTLRDGIHELRVGFGSVNYRLLYGFHRGGNVMAILAHGLTKEKEVPAKDIDLAIRRMEKFKAFPERHSYTPPDQNEEVVL